MKEKKDRSTDFSFYFLPFHSFLRECDPHSPPPPLWYISWCDFFFLLFPCPATGSSGFIVGAISMNVTHTAIAADWLKEADDESHYVCLPASISLMSSDHWLNCRIRCTNMTFTDDAFRTPGRFLHGNVTLSALCLPLGRTCVMHLVQRENLPDSGNSQDSRLKSKERSTGCCTTSCSVL